MSKERETRVDMKLKGQKMFFTTLKLKITLMKVIGQRKLLFPQCKYSSKSYGFEDNDKSMKTLPLSTCVKNLTNFKDI